MSLAISVILPTHDRPDGLRRAVDSILAQTRLPEEIVVVNDGSCEIPGELAGQAAAAGVSFRSERRQVPSLPASRNRGAELAAGDVLAFLEDDVVVPPDYLARLAALYEADRAGLVAGIGARVVEAGRESVTRRAWDFLAVAMGVAQWSPRVRAARYARLPPALAGRLRSAPRLSGGAMSVRRTVAMSHRFTEAFSGYATGEDREFSFRVGRVCPLFLATELAVLHERATVGRPGMFARGRMYAANSLYIARNAVEGGAGTWLLAGYDFLGCVLLYAAYGLPGRNRENLAYAAGVLSELFVRAMAGLRKLVCG